MPLTSLRYIPVSLVRCCTRQHLVEVVQPTRKAGADPVVAMACMEGQAIGQLLTMFFEREIGFEVMRKSSLEVMAQQDLDQHKQFS